METIPDRLKQQMDLLGLSNRALARQVGCYHSFINRLVSGDVTSCTDDLARAIAEALKVHVDLLFVTRVPSLAGRNVQDCSPAPRSRRRVA